MKMASPANSCLLLRLLLLLFLLLLLLLLGVVLLVQTQRLTRARICVLWPSPLAGSGKEDPLQLSCGRSERTWEAERTVYSSQIHSQKLRILRGLVLTYPCRPRIKSPHPFLEAILSWVAEIYDLQPLYSSWNLSLVQGPQVIQARLVPYV